MRVLSVNVGRPRPNPWKRVSTTGIDKRPVAGPVAVTVPGPKGDGSVGLAGDHAYDIQHHGGSDQAVYAYAREDLDRWERELGRKLPGGSFGENLTTAGIDVNEALIGERWRIGSTLLEVSCPRVPCATFAGWLDERGWLKRFTQAAVPGAYLRVIEPGHITAGDPITVEARPDEHEVTVAVSFRAITTAPELLPLLVDLAAYPAGEREEIRRRLAR